MGCAHFIPLLLKREAFEKVPGRRAKGKTILFGNSIEFKTG